MKPRALFVVGLLTGYVLGARAGRERYNQIVDRVNSLWQDPRVSQARRDAEAYARKAADRTVTTARDTATKTVVTARGAVDKTVTTARDTATKTTTAARGAADRTVAAAAKTASRVGEARDHALANLDDLGDIDDDN